MTYQKGQGPAHMLERSLAEPHAYFPTGECFNDALDGMCEMLANVPVHERRDWRLVHALCAWTEQRYAHAWFEDRKSVYEGKLKAGAKVYLVQPRKIFYRELKVIDPTYFTFEQALGLNYMTNHFGPWHKKYREACAQDIKDFVLGQGEAMPA